MDRKAGRRASKVLVVRNCMVLVVFWWVNECIVGKRGFWTRENWLMKIGSWRDNIDLGEVSGTGNLMLVI